MNKFETKGAVLVTVSVLLIMVMCIFTIDIDIGIFMILISNLLIMCIFVTGLLIIWYGIMSDYRLSQTKLKCKNMLENLLKNSNDKIIK